MSDTDQLTVRPAKPADVHYIRRLSKEVFQQYGPYENMLEQWFEEGITFTLLALMEEKPVGFAMLRRPERESFFGRVSELIGVAVEPTKWRLGIGDLLMIEIQRKARELKIETVILHTAVENLGGQSLFEKHGFVAADIKKHFYPKGQDALMMYKHIA